MKYMIREGQFNVIKYLEINRDNIARQIAKIYYELLLSIYGENEKYFGVKLGINVEYNEKPELDIQYIFDYTQNHKIHKVEHFLTSPMMEAVKKLLVSDSKSDIHFMKCTSFNNHLILTIFIDNVDKTEFSTNKITNENDFLFEAITKTFFDKVKGSVDLMLDDSSAQQQILVSHTYEMYGINWLQNSLNITISNMINDTIYNFFNAYFGINVDLVNRLTIEKYEGNTANGKLFIGLLDRNKKLHMDDSTACGEGEEKQSEHVSVNNLIVEFKEDIKFDYDNIRQLRKLLEITGDRLGLVIGEEQKIMGYSKSSEFDEGVIEIKGFQEWEFSYHEIYIRFINGSYCFSKEERKNSYSIKDFFDHLCEDKDRKLRHIIKEATSQRHGTLLIITDSKTAMEEASRLIKYKRALNIASIDLKDNLELVKCLSAIDGALIIDLDGICHAIGVILDGEVVVEGTPARGARYNSAINYIEWKKDKKILAVIISEDGSVDYYIKR